MFELFFGLLWSSFSFFILFLILNGQGNGDSTGFILIFCCLGIYFIIRGIIKIFRNFLTKTKGSFDFGIIANVRPNGSYVNGTPMYDAIIILCENSKSNEFKEDIGFNRRNYSSGQFVKVQKYKDDVNIISVVREDEAPLELQELAKNTITVNNYYSNLRVTEKTSSPYSDEDFF